MLPSGLSVISRDFNTLFASAGKVQRLPGVGRKGQLSLVLRSLNVTGGGVGLRDLLVGVLHGILAVVDYDLAGEGRGAWRGRLLIRHVVSGRPRFLGNGLAERGGLQQARLRVAAGLRAGQAVFHAAPVELGPGLGCGGINGLDGADRSRPAERNGGSPPGWLHEIAALPAHVAVAVAVVSFRSAVLEGVPDRPVPA